MSQFISLWFNCNSSISSIQTRRKDMSAAQLVSRLARPNFHQGQLDWFSLVTHRQKTCLTATTRIYLLMIMIGHSGEVIKNVIWLVVTLTSGDMNLSISKKKLSRLRGWFRIDRILQKGLVTMNDLLIQNRMLFVSIRAQYIHMYG